jgi:hypothetical protein
MRDGEIFKHPIYIPEQLYCANVQLCYTDVVKMYLTNVLKEICLITIKRYTP